VSLRHSSAHHVSTLLVKSFHALMVLCIIASPYQMAKQRAITNASCDQPHVKPYFVSDTNHQVVPACSVFANRSKTKGNVVAHGDSEICRMMSFMESLNLRGGHLDVFLRLLPPFFLGNLIIPSSRVSVPPSRRCPVHFHCSCHHASIRTCCRIDNETKWRHTLHKAYRMRTT
jgi:hypothetical protein